MYWPGQSVSLGFSILAYRKPKWTNFVANPICIYKCVCIHMFIYIYMYVCIYTFSMSSTQYFIKISAASRLYEDKFLVLKPPSLQYFVMAALANEYTSCSNLWLRWSYLHSQIAYTSTRDENAFFKVVRLKMMICMDNLLSAYHKTVTQTLILSLPESCYCCQVNLNL